MNCDDKEWQHCRVEKMGCLGCAYDKQKIKIGDYVRTSEGYIGKVINIDKKNFEETVYFIDNKHLEKEQNGFPIAINRISNYNENILKLLEAGDIVNGYKILELKEATCGEDILYVCIYKDTKESIWQEYNKNNISTILTHEQFKQNSYKVEE